MKKPTKRKMYHKRRKREKADQRKNDKTDGTPQITNNTPRLASKRKNNNYNNKQYHRMHNNHITAYNNQSELVNPLNSYTQGLQVWWHTYCTAIQYHTAQQKQSNKDQTNKDDASSTVDSNLTLFEKYANEYETSSEEEDEDANKQCLEEEEEYFLDDHNYIDSNMSSNAGDVDDEYLKFLEITHKHREELKLKRAEEDF